MISIQVIGNDTAVALAGSQGNFELNAMRPVIINNFLHSARILGDGCEKFLEFSVQGTTLNTERIGEYVAESLMLVTALSPGHRLPERRAHRRGRPRQGHDAARGRAGVRPRDRRAVRLRRRPARAWSVTASAALDADPTRPNATTHCWRRRAAATPTASPPR